MEIKRWRTKYLRYIIPSIQVYRDWTKGGYALFAWWKWCLEIEWDGKD